MSVRGESKCYKQQDTQPQRIGKGETPLSAPLVVWNLNQRINNMKTNDNFQMKWLNNETKNYRQTMDLSSIVQSRQGMDVPLVLF